MQICGARGLVSRRQVESVDIERSEAAVDPGAQPLAGGSRSEHLTEQLADLGLHGPAVLGGANAQSRLQIVV